MTLFARKPIRSRGKIQSMIIQPGQKYGRWTILWFDAKASDRRHPHWFCRCDCGTERAVYDRSLRIGSSTSCGCYLAKLASKLHYRHGQSGNHGRQTAEYESWCKAKRRCHNPADKAFASYGGRGIYMCDEWRGSFQAFFADMGHRPNGCSLDRMNNDGPYAPGNCRWATSKQQAANRRLRHDSRLLKKPSEMSRARKSEH